MIQTKSMIKFQKELLKAEQALWSGKELKDNKFYDGAINAVKKIIGDGDSKLFDKYSDT